MKVEDLTLPRPGGGYVVDHVSFELHAGEILGLYGLMGAGRSDLVDCLAGARPEASGKIWLNDQPVAWRLRSPSASRMGLCWFRRIASVKVWSRPCRSHDNILLASLKSYLTGFYLVPKKEKEAVKDMVKRLSIRVANVGQPITSLSGGNQQKCVVAKALLTAPKVLMLDEPTRGIDVGAKSEIFEITSRLAEQGYGVIFISTELKEVLAMSDRILVMSKGAITGEFSREEATEEKLVAASAIGHGLRKHSQSQWRSEQSWHTTNAIPARKPHRLTRTNTLQFLLRGRAFIALILVVGYFAITLWPQFLSAAEYRDCLETRRPECPAGHRHDLRDLDRRHRPFGWLDRRPHRHDRRHVDQQGSHLFLPWELSSTPTPG